MIIFKTIRWKNFLATGNAFTEINLNENNLTLLRGRSGSGKSTMLDAISFALFGRPFRNIKKDQLTNSLNKKECQVEVEFSIGNKEYTIVRGIKPTIFQIFINGELINQDAKSKDYQDYLEKSILKFNSKTFKQIVVLGASNFTPFMQLRPSDRRVIIEELLDIQVFSIMNTTLKEKLTQIKDNIHLLSKDLEILNEKINIHQKYIKELMLDKKGKILEIENKIKKSQGERKEYTILSNNIQENLHKFQIKLEKRNKTLQIYNKNQSKVSALNTLMKKQNKIIDFYKENSQCPTCRQDIDDEFKELEINKSHDEIHSINNEIEKNKSLQVKIKKVLCEFENIENESREVEKSLYESNSSISAIDKFIEQLTIDLSKLNEPKEMISDKKKSIKELKDKLKDAQERKVQSLEDFEIIKICIDLMKDDGIKAKIVKQYLPLINQYVNKFLESMNFFVTFFIDEEFNEYIKSRGRDNFSYENFSNGEQQRIDLALLFTWRVIAKMKNSINTNLLVMDEISDAYLDTDTTELVLNLLKSDFFKDTNIFVISHKDTISDNFDKILKFDKKKNFSKIID